MVKEEGVETEAPLSKKQKMEEPIESMETGTAPSEDVNKDDEEIMEVTPVEKKLDPFEANLKQEEDELARRSEAEDRKLFVNICGSIQSLMKDIVNIKNDKKDDWQEEVDEKKVQVLMLVLSLRRLSRVQKVRVKNIREQTVESRQCVDGVTLQLQNQLYEVAHLKKEIKRCLDFHSSDQDLQLVDLNTFYNEAPDSIAKPAETLENPHEQHLARLNWELEQRRSQTKLHEKLTNEKNKISALIADSERKLSSLGPQVNAILEATLPLQQALDLDLTNTREVQKSAQLLPIPLYTLWVQITSYIEVCDSSIKAEIKGNFDEAKKIALSNDQTETTDSDEVEIDDSSRKSQQQSKAKSDSASKGKKKLFAIHPLHVNVIVTDKYGNKVTLDFYYATTLRFVTTCCHVDLAEKLKLHIEGVFNKESFLECLLAEDYGMTSPNPVSTYLLQQSKVDLKDQLVNIGRPFRWAQTLCGLSFLKEEPTTGKGSVMIDEDSKDNSSDTTMTQPPKCTETVSSELSAEHVHKVVDSIRKRLKSRLLLHAQFANLLSSTTNNFAGINIPSNLLKANFPAKIDSHLNSWRPMTWNDYCSSSSTELLREAGAVNCHSMLYKAIIERKNARLDALVAVSPDHPKIPPIFSLTIHLKGNYNATNNPQIRQMECELNVHWKELINKDDDGYYLLPLLLYRLLMCMDVYTEAYSQSIKGSGSTSDFQKEKSFTRLFKGPDCSYPFKYNADTGTFSHRK